MTVPTTLRSVDDLILAQIRRVTADRSILDTPLQVLQEVHHIGCPVDSGISTGKANDVAATDTDARRRLSPSNVGARVCELGDHKAAFLNAEDEARLQLKQISVESHLGFLADPDGSQLKSYVVMHCAEGKQRSRATFLQNLRRDLELVVGEEDALSLVSQLLASVDQSWDHGEAATSAAPAGVELHFDSLIADEGVTEDAVAELWWKVKELRGCRRCFVLGTFGSCCGVALFLGRLSSRASGLRGAWHVSIVSGCERWVFQRRTHL